MSALHFRINVARRVARELIALAEQRAAIRLRAQMLIARDLIRRRFVDPVRVAVAIRRACSPARPASPRAPNSAAA